MCSWMHPAVMGWAPRAPHSMMRGGVIVYTNVGTGGKLSVNSDTNGATVYVGKSWLITSLS